jgi:hypothetical protein
LVRGNALREIVPISDADLARWQATDVNRKVQGDRGPTAIWNKWTPEMRDTFVKICWPGMVQYGYGE